LPFYTILMQLATGALFVFWLLWTINLKRYGAEAMDKLMRRPMLVMFITVTVANLGAHFHLSSPLKSFLAILNWRYSWLSREIVFNVVMGLCCAALVDRVWKEPGRNPKVTVALGWASVLLGCAAIYCMSNIYLLPTQALWNNGITVAQFFGSAVLLGASSSVTIILMDTIFTSELESELAACRSEILQSSFGWVVAFGVVGCILIAAVNGGQIVDLSRGDPLAKISYSLLLGLYRPLLAFRFLALGSGAVTLSLVAYWLLKKKRLLANLVVPTYLSCFLILVSEIIGRFLFYATHIRLGL